MQELVDIRGEIDAAEGKKPRTYDKPAKKRVRGSRGGSRGRSGSSDKPKKPQASFRSSSLAQAWVDRGTELGLEFPYDVNYFARALQKKIEGDPAFKKLMKKDKSEQVLRWVSKMIDLWWSEYVSQEISAKNAKEYFLQTDWLDVQEYARSSLRAAYLKQHGRRLDPPIYPAQQEYQDRLQEVRQKEHVGSYLRELDEDAERPELDYGGRERLRSWVEQRRKK